MFNGLLDTVRSEIVSQLFVITQRTFSSRRHSRLKVLNDQVWVRHC
jgi:hypothetical protein